MKTANAYLAGKCRTTRTTTPLAWLLLVILILMPPGRAAASRYAEALEESNEGPATATPLTLVNGLIKVTGNLFPKGDTDYYSFQATAGDRVYLASMTAASANAGNSELTLLASDSTTVIEYDNDDGSFSGFASSIAGATLPATGTYYIKYSDPGTATGTERPYDLYLQVRSGAPVAETEPNDTAAGPSPPVNPLWFSGTRNPDSDLDWFPVTLNAGDTVFLSLDMNPERDATVWGGRLAFGLVGDSTNQAVVVDDNGAGDAASTQPVNPSEALFFTVKNAGTYYVLVDSVNSTGAPDLTYHLSISILPAITETWTTYTSTDIPKTIGPTPGLVSSAITVPGHPRIAKIRVHINATHAQMADMDVHLRSPAGNDVGLFSDIGSGSAGGQTQMDITFTDDAALIPSFNQLRPYMLKPEIAYRLGWFAGEDAGGTWTLDIRDDTNNASGGTLNGWSIEIVEEPTPVAGSQILSTDFESGAAGFTHSGLFDQWELGTPATAGTTTSDPIAGLSTANSGVNCWKTNLTGTYASSSDQNLDSPEIDLTALAGTTGKIRLDWAMWYQMESANFDHAYVQIREVGGTGYTRKVWEFMDANMTDSPGNPTARIPASAGWGVHHADISDFAGKLIQVRFHMDTDSSVNFAGFAIDDVAVIAIGTPEIAIRGNGVNILSGDVTPSATDGTDFGGTIVAGGSVANMFTIANTDAGDLNLTGIPAVAISGPNALDFTVAVLPANPIVAGSSTTFEITFDPSAAGTRAATVTVASNDSDEGMYTFAIAGTGLLPPTVTTPTSADVITDVATLGGNVTSDGGAAISERGVVYAVQSLNSNPQVGGANVTNITASGTTGVFTVSSGPLEVGITYAFAAYATNSAGTAYSSVGTFTTLGVGNTSDSGPGSLRQALLAAAANPGPDSIVFNLSLSGLTIGLATPLSVSDDDDVTIDVSYMSPGVTISGATRLISHASSGTLTLRGFTLTGGNAPTTGGAISSFGTLILENCTLSGNSAATGGAIFSTGSLTLTNCTLTGNSATSGGAISHSGSLAVTHCTIAGNSAQAGGGISMTGGTWTLANSIVAGNSLSAPGNGRDIFNGGNLTRIGGNVVQVLFNSGGTETGTAAINADPLLNPLADNGGCAQTMVPHPTSPAIDQASVLSPELPTDQRSQPRPIGLRPDIGAVEGNVIVVTTPLDEFDPPGSPGAGISLREAMSDVSPVGTTIAFDRAVFSGLTATTNTITLTKGPLPGSQYTLYGTPNPGGITLVNAPTITSQPQSLTQATGTTAIFTVAAPDVNDAYAHQWRKNGIDIPLAIGPTLTLSNISEADEAVYDVRLFRASLAGPFMMDVRFGNTSEIVSQPASLIVDDATLGIKRDPASAMLALGSSHTLSVVAAGPGTLTYQWQLNGKNISGATKSTYLIAKAALTHAGAYTCLVKSGTVLPGVPSAAAQIGVVDTAAKTFHLKAGGSFSALVKAAGNGPLSFAWLRNGESTAFFDAKIAIADLAVADAGLYTCTVTGAAGTFTGGAPTLLTVSSGAPQIVKPLTLPPAFIGQHYFYQIPIASVAGAQATAFTVGGLPPGMTWDKLTGIIYGRPTASTKPLGYPLTIKASNPVFSDSTTATLQVHGVPATAVGTFAGPLERSAFNDNLGGRFDLVTTITGTCSGSVTLGARAKLPFTNQLLLSAGAGDVILRANISGITLADKTVLTAYIEVFASDQRAVLTLVHPTLGTTLVATAWRNIWSKTRPASAYAATYNARLDPAHVGIAPQGYGFATLRVAADGSVKLSGKLPDGSGLTHAGFVGPEGQLMLFTLLHTKRGSLVGPMQITPDTFLADNTLNGTLSWFKSAPLPTSPDTVYRDGFGPLDVTVEGGPYIAPAPGLLVMGLGTAPNPNAKLAFTLGGLSPEFDQLLHITNPSATSLTNKATITAPLMNSTKVTILDAAKGMVVGSFTIAGASAALNRPAPFEGLIVKIGATAQGYGYFLLPSVPVGTQKVTTSPKLSGRLVLRDP